MAAAPLSSTNSNSESLRRSKFSKSKVEHAYETVTARPIMGSLCHRRAEGGEWVMDAEGTAAAKFMPDSGHYFLFIEPVDGHSTTVTSIQVTPGLEFKKENSNDIVWKDPNTDRELKLSVDTLAGRDLIIKKLLTIQEIGRAIEDTDARAKWYEAFPEEVTLTWSRFFCEFEQWIGRSLSDVEDSLKSILSTASMGGSVTPDSLNVFLKWFGPLALCYDKWTHVRSLIYFHGQMNRERAEAMLGGQPPKSFILRYSEPGFFAVSYVAADNRVLHFRIENAGAAGFAMLTAEEEVLYELTIAQLLERQNHILDIKDAVESNPFSNVSLSAISKISPSSSASSAASTSSQSRSSAVLEPIVFLSEGWLTKTAEVIKTPDDGVRVQAAGMIVSWVEADDNKFPFCSGGGLALIGQLVNVTSDTDVRRLAVRAVCALVAAPKCKLLIVDQALPALFVFAASDDEQIQQYAAFIFANLVLNDVQIQQILLERDCLSALNALARSSSAYVQANVAWVFGNLAQHDNNKKPILLGGLQSLFLMAQSDNDKVKKYAFDALGCLGIVDGDDVGKLIAQVKASLDPKPVWEIDYSAIEDLVLVDSGGYGNVYMGKYLHMKVAVKLLKKSQLRDLEAFKAEIATMSRLRHPNVVLFMGATTNPLTIVTEYMSRKSLFDVIHDHTVDLNSRLVLKMCRDIALGMSYLHSLKIVHRDLKSLNLLVDDNFNIKIADFGLSRVVATDTTNTPHGTYAWRPPEMFKSEAYDHRVDVYSFGIVLWELYSRDIPFDGMNYEDIKKAVLSGRRPSIRSTTDPIFEELIGLMKACWQQNPAIRPSFDDICVGLEEVAASM